MNKKIHDHFQMLYGAAQAADLTEKLTARLSAFASSYQPLRPFPAERVSEKDAILITYGDMVQAEGERPLATLGHFLQNQLAGIINTIHILPFYPYSSDDGFSVIDYKAVNPEWGDWEDVARIGKHFRLMFDAVVNHASAQSGWFEAFLRDEEPYQDYFTVVEAGTDVTAVFRPRTHPLLTPFTTPSGSKLVWTTFSADQVDLNFANPELLLEILDVLLFYVQHGAEFIRLDAIAYIWKELGTSCLHLPQAHEIVQLMRTVLNEAAPQVSLITETNVPHVENISYFGDGHNEAQMVYNFSLPPLTLHAFHTGSAEVLSNWASTLELPSDEVTFFNFLASHDGIGVQPARGLLPDTAVTAMAKRIEALGGYVSYKTNSDGSQSPYELNCNYLDALGDPDKPDEPVATVARRFMAAQAIMLALKGVPGIYFHSLFGSTNWPEGVELTGQRRTINRQKLAYATLTAELDDTHSLRSQILRRYTQLLQIRQAEPAFHPQGRQEILFWHEAVFAVERWSRYGRSTLICLQNVSDQSVDLQGNVAEDGVFVDLLGNGRYKTQNGQLIVTMEPYGILWLKKEFNMGSAAPR